MRKAPGADTPRRDKSGGRPNEEAGLPVVVTLVLVVVMVVVAVLGDVCADTDTSSELAPQVVLERRASRGLVRIGEDGFWNDCDIIMPLSVLLLTRLGFVNNGGGGGGSVEEVVPLFQDACTWCC
jgi:hypothetical protein